MNSHGTARSRAPVLAGLAALLLCAGASAVETMRCDGGLVSTGDSRQRVLALCGPPLRRYVERRPVWVTNRLGARVEVFIDQDVWVFDRGYGRFVGLLRFDGETLRRIEYGPRRE